MYRLIPLFFFEQKKNYIVEIEKKGNENGSPTVFDVIQIGLLFEGAEDDEQIGEQLELELLVLPAVVRVDETVNAGEQVENALLGIVGQHEQRGHHVRQVFVEELLDEWLLSQRVLHSSGRRVVKVKRGGAQIGRMYLLELFLRVWYQIESGLDKGVRL